MRLRSLLVALFLYTLLLFASFYPESFKPVDTIAYIGDALESVYLVAWNVHQFFRSPFELFEANFLYPNPRALAFTDHRLLPSLLVAPVIWISRNPVLAYHVALALGSLLAAFAARSLARQLGANDLGAWTAGALYAFHTYQIHEAPRLNIIFHGFLPLALGQLLLLLSTGKRKHALGTGAFMLLQGLSANYHLLYGSLLLGLTLVVFLIARPGPTLRRLPSLFLVAFLAGMLYFPFAWPYLENSTAHDYHRELPRGIDLQHYVTTRPTNFVYGPMGAEFRLQQRGPHFVGFVSLALGLLALGLVSRRQKEASSGLLPDKLWVPAAAGFFLLFQTLALGRDIEAWGMTLGPGPYRILYHVVPGFQLVRIPERLSLLAMLFLALLVAGALSRISRAGYRSLGVLLAALVPLEHLSTMPHIDRIPIGEDVPAVYRWLEGDRAQAIAEVPVHGEGLVRKETLEMYFSTYHYKPLIHGYTAFPPALSGLLRKMGKDFPSEASLQVFQRVGVDTIILHRGRDAELDRRVRDWVEAGRLRQEARFAGSRAKVYEGTEDIVYRLVPCPAVDPAPFPGGRRLRAPTFRYRTKVGDPAPAADGDVTTAWEVRRPLNGDEFYEITFDEARPVSGLVMVFGRNSAFPNRFKIAGRQTNGEWLSLRWFDAAHALQLLESLRASPPRLRLGFDLGGRELTGLRIMIEKGGKSFFGWSIPEIEVRVPDESQSAL